MAAREWFKTEPRPDNSHVSNILPLTTFRTIDLGGKKNFDPLVSIFWEKTRVFFELNSAPEYVQKNENQENQAQGLGADTPTLKTKAPGPRLRERPQADAGSAPCRGPHLATRARSGAQICAACSSAGLAD